MAARSSTITRSCRPTAWRSRSTARPGTWRCTTRSRASVMLDAPPRLRGRPVVAAGGQRLPELAAGGDIELGENLGHVVLDGARPTEQLSGDLRIGQARPGRPRDLGLLRGGLLVRAGG